jgi:hypothetical protein
MYWPTPDASHYDSSGDFASADVLTIAAGLATRFTAFKATATPVIYHRSTKTFDTINLITVGNIVGTQRRRTNKDVQAYVSETF